MCGRFTLTASPAPLLRQIQIPFDDDAFVPRYNIAPTQQVLGVVAESGASPRVASLRWGLIPHWAEDPARVRGGFINARAETAAAKPSFRTPFRRRRCLVLADGFYEWQETRGEKQPYRVVRQDRQPFAMAGLWDRWQGPAALTLATCTILTTEASPGLAEIHPRMPVILHPTDTGTWLDVDGATAQELAELLVPFTDEDLTAYPVSTRVNRAANDGPALIEAVPEQGNITGGERG